jgi:phosphoserine phosphatase RsbU/P
VVGGVETFRDMSSVLADLERARRIQALSLEHDLPQDDRIRFATYYTPHDIVGGDFFAIRRLDSDRYGFLLADVTGHGIAAALHTMHLSSVWTRHHGLLTDPPRFAATMNNELGRVVKDESFATAVCGVIDARERSLRLASAGGPPVLVMRADGPEERLESPGYPFGLMENAPYEEVAADLHRGDCLLLFSDGAFEIHNAQGELLGVEGLVHVLKGLGYPEASLRMKALEEELLRYSNDIRLVDDVTLIEARLL